MQYDAAAGGNVPAIGGEALLALAPGVAAIADCRVENWARMPACHFTQADHWRLRERVRVLATDPAVDGIVVTLGTDTLEEAAYLLDRTLASSVPVVCTGAMRTSDDPEWDGARNLVEAVRVAAAPASQGRGTQVVFAGDIWQGCEAVKVDTVALRAFGAPFAARRGYSDQAGVVYAEPATPRPVIVPATLNARVALVPMVIGDDGAMLDAARVQHDGVVLEAFGSGNLPPGALPAIARWHAAQKPVVLSSRCAGGRVTPVYAFEGGGARVVAAGAIPAGPRTPSQARWELTIALSAGACVRQRVSSMNEPILIPEEVLEIARALERAGFEAWCVGGALRDTLLGQVQSDFDIATSAKPSEVQRIFPRTVPIGIRFGTVGVLDRRRQLHEVTTFRRDVETDGRHAVVQYGVSLEDDLARRDFTINALAYHPLRAEWRDPFNGRDDIERRLIRAVGDPGAAVSRGLPPDPPRAALFCPARLRHRWPHLGGGACGEGRSRPAVGGAGARRMVQGTANGPRGARAGAALAGIRGGGRLDAGADRDHVEPVHRACRA